MKKIFFIILIATFNFLHVLSKTALVCGAGGFIGNHLVKKLKKEGYWVRAVDVKFPTYSKSLADEFLITDLRNIENAYRALNSTEKFDEIYQLAANVGGIGYIESHDSQIMHDSILININILEACKELKINKVFFASSSCIYPKLADKQNSYLFSEDLAYPANPENEYGWEKLFSERLYKAYAKDFGIKVRIARFFNVFGPEDVLNSEKEKAINAICRKAVLAKEFDEIEIWGDGKQKRSFIYVDDCVEGIYKLMQNNEEPYLIINLGSEKSFFINEIAELIIKISGKNLKIKNIEGPVGTLVKNSNNAKVRSLLNWEPNFDLAQNLKKTYQWVFDQMKITTA